VAVVVIAPGLGGLRPLEQAAVDEQALAAVEQQLMAGAGHPVMAAVVAQLHHHPVPVAQGNPLVFLHRSPFFVTSSLAIGPVHR